MNPLPVEMQLKYFPLNQYISKSALHTLRAENIHWIIHSLTSWLHVFCGFIATPGSLWEYCSCIVKVLSASVLFSFALLLFSELLFMKIIQFWLKKESNLKWKLMSGIPGKGELHWALGSTRC